MRKARSAAGFEGVSEEGSPEILLENWGWERSPGPWGLAACCASEWTGPSRGHAPPTPRLPLHLSPHTDIESLTLETS